MQDVTPKTRCRKKRNRLIVLTLLFGFALLLLYQIIWRNIRHDWICSVCAEMNSKTEYKLWGKSKDGLWNELDEGKETESTEEVNSLLFAWMKKRGIAHKHKWRNMSGCSSNYFVLVHSSYLSWVPPIYSLRGSVMEQYLENTSEESTRRFVDILCNHPKQVQAEVQKINEAPFRNRK